MTRKKIWLIFIASISLCACGGTAQNSTEEPETTVVETESAKEIEHSELNEAEYWVYPITEMQSALDKSESYASEILEDKHIYFAGPVSSFDQSEGKIYLRSSNDVSNPKLIECVIDKNDPVLNQLFSILKENVTVAVIQN